MSPKNSTDMEQCLVIWVKNSVNLKFSWYCADKVLYRGFPGYIAEFAKQQNYFDTIKRILWTFLMHFPDFQQNKTNRQQKGCNSNKRVCSIYAFFHILYMWLLWGLLCRWWWYCYLLYFLCLCFWWWWCYYLQFPVLARSNWLLKSRSTKVAIRCKMW